jgi:hypothetical protein
MKFFGLNLLAITLLFAQGKLSYGAPVIVPIVSVVWYKDGGKPQEFKQDQCISAINDKGFGVEKVWYRFVTECQVYADTFCSVRIGSKMVFPQGYTNKPPTDSKRYRCWRKLRG